MEVTTLEVLISEIKPIWIFRDIILVPLNQHIAYRRNFKEDQSVYLDNLYENDKLN